MFVLMSTMEANSVTNAALSNGIYVIPQGNMAIELLFPAGHGEENRTGK